MDVFSMLQDQEPSPTELEEFFSAFEPWVTAFDIAGRRFGGSYHAASDPRLVRFLERFTNPGRVLELGSLEGGHTFALGNVACEVVAIEGRERNLEKSRWLQSIYGFRNISFIQSNIEDADFAGLGTFDVVFNLGVLYHMPRPWELLRRLAPITEWMYLWTHVARRPGGVDPAIRAAREKDIMGRFIPNMDRRIR